MACHARDGERWTFFEIDPAVERMARDPRLFSYLRDCAGRHDVVLGDARVEMRDVPSGSFGIIAVDAFNSDAIPTHLLTREALSLYRERLTPNGVLALHISNRYLDIEPVVGNLARDLRMACLEQIDASITSDTPGKSISDWVALARRDADLGRIVRDSRWRRCRVDPGSRSWTDDYTNLLGLLTAR
jgi:spermidine synthase